MQIILDKKPKNVTLIEGFPGFGLVSTIACEFLLDHLKTEQIGKVLFEDAAPMVAIHESKVVDPLGIFYNKQYNIVIVHAVTTSQGNEWKFADVIAGLAEQLTAKEIISLEGVGSGQKVRESQAFYYATDEKSVNRFKEISIDPLKEGIIMGVTAALLIKTKEPISCIFAEAHTNLPDSKAAAKLIETLDKYLGLKVDYAPLLEQASKFEDKLRGMIDQGQQAQEMADKKRMSYVG
ncbi:MAG TPA: PAC2 family protein [Candidatus Nanoarchaeia archaeon]|nr:PAC2 family protein [Candidatus Nanoarchaeia archaeon]